MKSSTSSALATCMLSFDSIRQLRNGKKYGTAISIKMSECASAESSPIMNASERNVEDEPEAHVSTQDKVNDQIKNHNAPLTSQLEDLT